MARPRQPHSEYLINRESQPVWWRDLPIKVLFDTTTMSEEQLILSRLAFQIWNSAIGEEVFQIELNWVEESSNQNLYQSLENSNTIIVQFRTIPSRLGRNQRLGYCHYNYLTDRFGIDRAIHSVEIVIHDQLSWEEITFIVLHEAGHALGLMHDNRLSSIMYRAPLIGGMNIEDQDIEYIKTQIALLRMRQNEYHSAY